MNHYHTQYKEHILNIDAKSVDAARKEAISYFIRYGSPADVRENVMVTGRVYESIPKAREIIDEKFLEDYFYNS